MKRKYYHISSNSGVCKECYRMVSYKADLIGTVTVWLLIIVAYINVVTQ